MTTRDTLSRSRDEIRPSSAFDLVPRNTEGAGKTGCWLHPRPRVQCRKHTSVVATGSTGATRPSLRNGVTAYTRSPRSTGLDSLRHRADHHQRDSIPASGDQDHTTLPSAASIIRRTDVAASIASRPAFVTTRTPLLPRRDAGNEPYISEKRKRYIFRAGS